MPAAPRDTGVPTRRHGPRRGAAWGTGKRGPARGAGRLLAWDTLPDGYEQRERRQGRTSSTLMRYFPRDATWATIARTLSLGQGSPGVSRGRSSVTLTPRAACGTSSGGLGGPSPAGQSLDALPEQGGLHERRRGP